MIATYQIKPNELDTLTKILKSSFQGEKMKVTIETVSDESSLRFSDKIVRKQLDEALQWEQSGKPAYRTMSVDALEAMI